MPTKQIIKPSKSAPAVGPYNHAVRVGDMLFCAGQIPLDPATGNLVTGDIKAQTGRVLENVKAILDDQKLTFANVVKSTVFLTDLANFAGMNEVYAKYFTENFPARSTIQVAGLRSKLMEAEFSRASAEANRNATEKSLVEQRALQEKALADLRDTFKAL